jgi:Domain of unknown function (DUF4383)
MMSPSSTGARAHDDERSPAQWYCLLAGAALLLVGIFGFLADGTFDTATNGELQGDSFLGFEVNGWHNVVHLASGIVLLAAAVKATTAKPVALTFGLVYGLVTIIGLIDGDDVIGLIPVNAADNVLHLALSALGIVAALISRGHDREDRRAGTTATDRFVRPPATDRETERVTR